MSESKSKTIEIGPDGTIRMPYEDGIQEVVEELGGRITNIHRASQVEWEEGKGWAVRAEHDKTLAARKVFGWGGQLVTVSPLRDGPIHFFKDREKAIKWELAHFYELLPPKEQK